MPDSNPENLPTDMGNENELALANQRLRELLDASTDGTFIADIEGILIDVSERFASFLGHRQVDLVGSSVFDIFTEANVKETPVRIDLVMEEGALTRSRIVKHASGREIPVVASALRLDAGGFLVSMRSIEAETKAAERIDKQTREIEEYQTNLNRLIDVIPGAIYRCERNGEWRAKFLSAYIEELSGYPAEDFVKHRTRKLSQIIHPDDLKRFNTIVDRSVESGEPWEIEYRIVCEDGSERWVIDQGRASRDVNDEVRYIDGLIIDHSSAKKLELDQARLAAELRQAQKLETLGRLAGGIAHDFNNLLSPIIGIAELAMLKINRDHPHFRRFENIHSAGKRAADLTSRLLAFSQKQELNREVIDLGDEIVSNQPLLRRLIREDIEISYELTSDGCSVALDRVQLSQVIMNLCINSMHAIESYAMENSRGRIDVRLARVVLDEGNEVGLEPRSYAFLRISDNGTGMDELTAMQVFEPFFTTKDKGQGTGLGLATAHGIIEQHGGHIEVTSELGVGTTFSIYLPLASRTAAHSRASRRLELVSQPRSETILLVEDDEMVREVVMSILLEAGFGVLVAKDAHDAIDIVAERDAPIAMLISDVVMPRLSGTDLFRRLQRMIPKLPALFMSGYANDVLRDSVADEARTAFLAKPFSPEDLVRKVEQLLHANV